MELNKKLKELRTEAKAILDGIVDREPTAEEVNELKRLNAEIEEKTNALQAVNMFKNNSNELENLSTPASPSYSVKDSSPVFVPELKEYMTKNAHRPEGVGMDRFEYEYEFKNLTSNFGASNGSSLGRVGHDPYVAPQGRRLRVLDFVSRIPTTADNIVVPALVSMTNNAASQLQATSVAAASGSPYVKAESDLTWGSQNVVLNSIAHYLYASRQILADAPRLEDMIANKLTAGVLAKFEALFFNASAASNGWNGIDNITGIQTQTFSTNLVTSIRKGLTKLRTAADLGEYAPNAIFMNPADWETLSLTQVGSGNDYALGAVGSQRGELFGVPVIESANVPSGYAYVGDFTQVHVYERENFRLYMSDSHGETFTKNIITLLGEARMAMALPNPKAIVKVALS